MIHIAKDVSQDSWLRDPRYGHRGAWFLAGHEYAQTQTTAIPALAKCSPEELWHAVMAILRGGYVAGMKPPTENEL